MSEDFFDNPFDEETNQKLQFFSDYIGKWLPVFLKDTPSFIQSINIFDFFAGVGMDPNGTYGSPLLILDHLNKLKDLVDSTNVPIRIFFNDKNKDYCDRLLKNIEVVGYNSGKISVTVTISDFRDAFNEAQPRFQNAANLIFLDQFGVQYVDRKIFEKLIKLKTTDVLFFVSSSTFNRFPEHQSIRPILDLSPEEIGKRPSSEIHRAVTEKYQSFIPDNKSYCIAPFSIKKGSNIYGLIFGSSHPLGVEKFLDICWEQDELRGEANFDIHGENINLAAPSLFAEMNIPNKIQVFQAELESKILSEELKSDLDIYLYSINHGFINKQIEPVISKLRREKRIILKHPSFRCGTVWKKDRKPKPVEVLK